MSDVFTTDLTVVNRQFARKVAYELQARIAAALAEARVLAARDSEVFGDVLADLESASSEAERAVEFMMAELSR